MIFTRQAVQTKRHVRDSRAIRLERRPHTFEVPAVRDEAYSQTSIADRAKRFRKLGMKRRFAASEIDPRDVGLVVSFINYSSQQIEWEEFGV
jgi:hypothetical protein